MVVNVHGSLSQELCEKCCLSVNFVLVLALLLWELFEMPGSLRVVDGTG